MSLKQKKMHKTEKKRISVPISFDEDTIKVNEVTNLEPEFYCCSNPTNTGGNKISLRNYNKTHNLSQNPSGPPTRHNSTDSVKTESQEVSIIHDNIILSMPIGINDCYSLSDVSDFDLE